MNLITYNADDAFFYKRYYPLLIDAMERVSAFISSLSDSYTSTGGRDPIEHVLTRIKTASSMKAKLARRGIDITAANSLAAVHDSVGIRIVCTFISDVYDIAEKLRNWPDINVSCEKDYIKHPKPNGYRSYHMVCSINENGIEIALEIQLRTVAMDCWAALEHQIKYKKTIPNQEIIERELKKTADDIFRADKNLEHICSIMNGDI